MQTYHNIILLSYCTNFKYLYFIQFSTPSHSLWKHAVLAGSYLTKCNFFSPFSINILISFKCYKKLRTRKLCYRKDDRAMRAI